jgi:hypothetical protein
VVSVTDPEGRILGFLDRNARIPRTLKATAFNDNGIWRQLSKLLQDIHIDVVRRDPSC